MLVETEEDRARAAERLLQAAGCEPADRVTGLASLPGALAQARADLLVLSVSRPDDRLFQRLLSLQAEAPLPVVLFTADESQAAIRRAIQCGVSAYVSDGVNPLRIRSILDAAVARFKQFNALAEELLRTRSQLSERKVVERAKGIIMAQRGLTEEHAYKLMRKTAMDRNKRMAEIADSIIAASELLTERPGTPPALVPMGMG